MQLRTHAQKLFDKVRNATKKGTNVINFIRSKQTAWFFTQESGCAFCHAPDPVELPLEKKNILSGIPSAPNEEHKTTSHDKRVAQTMQHESSRNKRSTEQESGCTENGASVKKLKADTIEDDKDLFGIVTSIPSSKNSLKNGNPVAAVPQEQQVEKKEQGMQINLVNLPPPPSSILPPWSINDSLKKLQSELGNFGARLEEDYAERKGVLESEKDLSKYWKSLQDCTISLQHIVNDIRLSHWFNEQSTKQRRIQQIVPQGMHSIILENVPKDVHIAKSAEH